MRGSDHDKSLREYHITSAGLEVLEPFSGLQGLISGNPTVLTPSGSAGVKMDVRLVPEPATAVLLAAATYCQPLNSIHPVIVIGVALPLQAITPRQMSINILRINGNCG